VRDLAYVAAMDEAAVARLVEEKLEKERTTLDREAEAVGAGFGWGLTLGAFGGFLLGLWASTWW
jgi:uncharacterized membrane protein